MANLVANRSLRGKRIVSIIAWALLVCFGVFKMMRHPGNLGFGLVLGILVGIMVIFNELKALLEEPE